MDDGSQIGSSSVAFEAEVSEVLKAVIERAKKAYYCRKNCTQLQVILEQVQPVIVASPASSSNGGLIGFPELLEEAKVVVEACEDGGVRHPLIMRIWSKYMMSCWILTVAQRIVLRCESGFLLADEHMMKSRKALRELGKLTLAAAGQQEMAKLGTLVSDAVDREDTAVLRDAYHRYMSLNGARQLEPMSSSDVDIHQVHSTPKMFFEVEDAGEVSEETG